MNKRGFAAMGRDTQRAIASKGGKAAHAPGAAHKAHEFTADEARAAGRKGAAATLARHGSGHMAAIGRKGGLARGKAKVSHGG